MATPQMPRRSERLSALARFIIQAFWAIGLGIVLMWAFFVVLGAIDPADTAPVTIAVAALVALGAARAWAASHRAGEERDRRLIAARERRGF